MEKRYYKHKIENLLNIGKIVTIHYFEFDKNFAGGTESHDFWELVYADKGTAICVADGKEIVLSEGEALFHKPNETHSLRANGQVAPNIFIISFDCKSESVRFFENRKLKLEKRLIRFIYPIIEESKKTFDLPYSDPALKKMKLLPSPTLGGQQLIKNYLEILLISLMREETEKSDTEIVFLPREELGEHVADQVISFLKENLYETPNVNDICKALHYNKSYIFKQFKLATSCSVMSYFRKLKIEEAKKLLRETNLSVTQIANKLAFDTPNYFSKTFKKITGYTPLRYKKMRKH
ncbi:MAG: helix-turn-helix domain-containing protein [Clostridia bacterium]|nr:helix-turn-helix domain-containing protein [Clostridia bacterium]